MKIREFWKDVDMDAMCGTCDMRFGYHYGDGEPYDCPIYDDALDRTIRNPDPETRTFWTERPQYKGATPDDMAAVKEILAATDRQVPPMAHVYAGFDITCSNCGLPLSHEIHTVPF